MHSHDDALIAALAEGTLDPSQAAAAEAGVIACARCRAELEAQRTALAALHTATPVVLHDQERASLRAAVSSALGLEPAAASHRVRRRTVPWGAIGLAAASLAAIVAVVPLAGLLGTAADSDDAATALAVTTVPAAVADAAIPSEPNGVGVPEGDLAEASGGVDGEAQLGTVPETRSSTTTAPAEPFSALTIDEVAAGLAARSLEPLDAGDQPAACAAEADSLLGAGAAALARPVLVDGTLGVGYVAGDGSSAVVFDLQDCRRLALLP